MAEKVKLVLSDDSSDSEENFHVNADYANKYDKWRQNEELQKLRAKYGDESLSSSSSESEDEETPIIEKDFLKTLSLLKSKDPKIYDENQTFFTGEEEQKPSTKKKTIKPFYMKDYERKRLLETNGELSSDNEDAPINISPTYDEEQQQIKESFKAVLANSDNDNEDESDLLQVRTKDEAEKGKDDDDYIQWLKGEKEDLPKDESDKDLKYLHDFWNDPKLENDEQFLKDYILEKKYMEEDNEDEIPTYEEITNDVNTLSDDEDLLNKQEVFEHKYNFRFEEPDNEFIKKYPRTVGDSLRRTDNKRKLKREDYQERKRQEKEQKREEIKRLKALKRAQIDEMLDKLKETTGNDKLGFDYADIDGDFDPNEHDKKMKELFDDEYYQVDEDDKPQFPSDDEIDPENWDNWTGTDNQSKYNIEDGPYCDDPNFNMDADYDPKLEFQRQMIESQSAKSKKKRRKSKFAEALSKPKPVFDPSEKSLEQYVEDYYKLDCEDVIGGELFRFKYRNVMPNNFGLSPDEILKARDKELNKWCSLKKTCQHRSEQEEKYDITAFSKKAENLNAKKKILPSLFENVESKNESKLDKQKSKKKTLEINAISDSNLNNDNSEITEKQEHVETDSIKTTMPIEESEDENKTTILLGCDTKSGSNQDSTNISKKKKRKKKKKTNIASDNTEIGNLSVSVTSKSTSLHSQNQTNPLNVSKKKKNKKRKIKADNGETFVKSPLSKKARKNLKTSTVDDKRLLLSDARLKAYGINPKKFKNRIKYSALSQSTTNHE